MMWYAFPQINPKGLSKPSIYYVHTHNKEAVFSNLVL